MKVIRASSHSKSDFTSLHAQSYKLLYIFVTSRSNKLAGDNLEISELEIPKPRLSYGIFDKHFTCVECLWNVEP